MYIDNIIVTGNDDYFVKQAKEILQNHFKIKDLGKFCYFLGIEVYIDSKGIFLGQRKYINDLVEDYNIIEARPVITLMEIRFQLITDDEDLVDDPTEYRMLTSHLIYLNVT